MAKKLRVAHHSAAAAPIHVVLAEEHETMRHSLRMVLDAERDVDVVAAATDAEATLTQVLAFHPEVLVLDMRMHDVSNIHLIEHLHEQEPSTEIVVLTMQESPAFARRALAAGAVGFVVKDSADSELPEAVRRAAHHVGFTSPRVAAGMDVKSA